MGERGGKQKLFSRSLSKLPEASYVSLFLRFATSLTATTIFASSPPVEKLVGPRTISRLNLLYSLCQVAVIRMSVDNLNNH